MKNIHLLLLISAIFLVSCKSKKVESKPGPGGIQCNQFRKNADGSWSPTSQITISSNGSSATLGPGVSFQPGQSAFLGIDFGTWLNNNCK